MNDDFEVVEITIHPDGTAAAIHSDAAAALLAQIAPIWVERASDVEWSTEHGGWRIHFRPWTGLADPDLTFSVRREALAHEVALLGRHRLFCGSSCNGEKEEAERQGQGGST
jgi:hypothetical protein